MKVILRTLAFISIAARRLISQPGLALLTLLGLVVSITLVMGVPLYADAVYHRTFLENLEGPAGGSVVEAEPGSNPSRPPFSFMFLYTSSWSGVKQWEDILPLNQFLCAARNGTDQNTELETALNLPVRSCVQYVTTDSGRMTAPGQETQLKIVNLGWMSDIQPHIEIVEGTWPTNSSAPASDEVIQVVLSLPMANELGLQVGESYELTLVGVTETGVRTQVKFPFQISGIWQPLDSSETYWIFNPTYLINSLLVSEDAFVNQVSPVLPNEVYSAFWYLVMDSSSLRSNQVNAMISRILRMQNQAAALLPGLDFSVSPIDNLRAYQRAASSLTLLLYAFATPVMGLILAFISLVASLSIDRKQNEIAITRSRGAATSQMLASVALESLLLALSAFLISLPLALLLTQWLTGSTVFELKLENLTNTNALQAGMVAILVALAATLSPVFRASKHTIVTYKLERARSLRPPFWQRAWLDVLLLIPAGYGAYLLQNPAFNSAQLLAAAANDPLSNPLLFLVPSLAVFSLTLLCLRLVPPLMSFIGWLAGYTRSVGVLLAARHLSRAPTTYHTPFIILVLTLSLSTYTASLARTLDQHMFDQAYYQVGADMKFMELGESRATSAFATPQVQASDVNPQFVFLPISEYLKIPKVENVTRLGSYPATIRTSTGQYIKARFYGIDRLDFPLVAYWRRDFAAQSLGALMNALAVTPEGVLLPRATRQQLALQVGDPVQIEVNTQLQTNRLTMKIVGDFDLFPTWYPDGPGQVETASALVVGNLDYLFEQAGSEYPYHIWLKLAPGADPVNLGTREIQQLGLRVVAATAAQPLVQSARLRPERQGLFGLLFIGFSAAAVLAVLGFLLYAVFSYQRRFIELGVLRAGGLSRLQMAVYLAFEMIFLIGLGGLLGTSLGIWASRFFIPLLQAAPGASSETLVPPFQVFVDWPTLYQMYGLFAALFLVTFIILTFLLQRMKIFQAIKLGETT